MIRSNCCASPKPTDPSCSYFWRTLDQIDALSAQIGQLTTRIGELIAAIPTAQGIDADGTTGPAAGRGDGAPVLPAAGRLDEITGIGREAAQAIIAEIGLQMSVFPTAGHLVPWAKISSRTVQSGAKNRSGKTGKGNPYLSHLDPAPLTLRRVLPPAPLR